MFIALSTHLRQPGLLVSAAWTYLPWNHLKYLQTASNSKGTGSVSAELHLCEASEVLLPGLCPLGNAGQQHWSSSRPGPEARRLFLKGNSSQLSAERSQTRRKTLNTSIKGQKSTDKRKCLFSVDGIIFKMGNSEKNAVPQISFLLP